MAPSYPLNSPNYSQSWVNPDCTIVRREARLTPQMQAARGTQVAEELREPAKMQMSLAFPHFVGLSWSSKDPLSVARPYYRRTISDVLSNDSMTRVQKVKVALQVAEALEFLHAHGLVHGSVSLSNIMIDDQGNAVLVDAQINRLLRRLIANGDPTIPHNWRYLSPADLLAGDQDAADELARDIYAFGNMLYELMTGASLYSRAAGPKKYGFVARKISSQDALLQTGIDGRIMNIIEGCRADPKHRHTMAEVMYDLAAAMRVSYLP